MKKWRRQELVRLALIVPGVAFVPQPFLAAGGESVLRQVRVGRSRDAFAVARAIEGAARHLESRRCSDLLTYFRDADGRTLAEVLSAEGVTARGHLRRLLFYSGEEQPRCQGGSPVVAWTVPGSRVVFVCPTGFRKGYDADPFRLEAVILHEMLHSLGLGENPPTSEEITSRVMAVCGG
jgi:hypothetical protein